MSEYRKFKRCIICRSRDNLRRYRGEFEETLLINTLYMTVMYPIEMRQREHMAKAKTIAQHLLNNCYVDLHQNDFKDDDIVRCLRNALAHYNVKVESYNGKVSSIKLWAINRPAKPICKAEETCGNPHCVPKQYSTDKNGEICTFRFSMDELRRFTYFVIDHALERLPDEVCQECRHRDQLK